MELAARMITPAVTGDDAQIWLFVVLGIAAAAVVVLLSFKDRIFGKSKDKQAATPEETAKDVTNKTDDKQ